MPFSNFSGVVYTVVSSAAVFWDVELRDNPKNGCGGDFVDGD